MFTLGVVNVSGRVISVNVHHNNIVECKYCGDSFHEDQVVFSSDPERPNIAEFYCPYCAKCIQVSINFGYYDKNVEDVDGPGKD